MVDDRMYRSTRSPAVGIRRDLRRRPRQNSAGNLQQRLDWLDELIASRWTVKILRALMTQERRFTQLKQMLPDVSANVLSKRVKELEEAGLIVKVRLPAPMDGWTYQLSTSGVAAKPLISAIERWARALPEQATSAADAATPRS